MDTLSPGQQGRLRLPTRSDPSAPPELTEGACPPRVHPRCFACACVCVLGERGRQRSSVGCAPEIFVSDVFVLFEFKSYLPGDILVNFSDPADRFVIILSGKVLVEFEHPRFDRENMTLKTDMYFGDLAIMGESTDLADSSSFNFLPQETETRDHTE